MSLQRISAMGPSSWRARWHRNAGERNVSEVLAIIRHALAHGNLYTQGDPIELLRLYSRKYERETCEKCGKPVSPLIGYRYLDIPVCGFKQFLFNWLELLRHPITNRRG